MLFMKDLFNVEACLHIASLATEPTASRSRFGRRVLQSPMNADTAGRESC